MPMPTYGPIWPTEHFPTTWLPPLTFPYDGAGDGSRGWLRLRSVHADHDLSDLGNPYAVGLVDIPDAGGYHVFAVTDDSATLCYRCVVDPANPVHPADGDHDGWGIAAWSYDGAHDGPLYCDHCGATIVDGEQ